MMRLTIYNINSSKAAYYNVAISQDIHPKERTASVMAHNHKGVVFDRAESRLKSHDYSACRQQTVISRVCMLRV
jgi:hypothetical protein